jgi:chromosome segregation ATPase
LNSPRRHSGTQLKTVSAQKPGDDVREDLSGKRTNRLLGFLSMLLGITGVVLCLACIAVAWKIQGDLDRTTARTFTRIDAALDRVQVRARQTNEGIQGVQASIAELNDRVQNRVAELRDIPEEDAGDIDQLERQMYARIQKVRAWIEFMQSTAELVDQLQETAVSTASFLQKDSHTTQDLVTALRFSHEEINVTSGLVEEFQQGLIEIRARRDVSENAKLVTTLSSRIDSSLKKVRGYTERFETSVQKTRTASAEVGAQIRWKIFVVSLSCTVFLLWMAMGQISLVVHGRRILYLS